MNNQPLSRQAAPVPLPAAADKTLYSLQALRFIAAALVVVSHIRIEYGMTPFGSAGVDIFFVISGFIIHYVTRNGAPQFFTRRLIRIVPLYWLGTLGLAAVALAAPNALNQIHFDLPLLLGSLFFWPMWNESLQYHLPLLMLGWSLNYEILFYLIYFIAMKLSHRHRMLISSLMLVGLATLHPFVAEKSALYYWSDAYIIEFIYGMLLAQLLLNSNFIAKARLPVLAAIAGLALYCFLLMPSTGLVTPEMAADRWLRIAVIGLPSTALIILALACEQSFRRLSLPVRSSINFLGELSYPIYIFHIYVMGVLKRLGMLELSTPVYVSSVALATLGLAAAVFLIYEQPVRRFLTARLIRRGPRSARATPDFGETGPRSPLYR